MSEFHDDYPQYELMAHHSDEAGVAKRKKLWTNSVICATPEITKNDLDRQIVSPEQFSLVIFDEAHHAVGEYSYVFISEIYKQQGKDLNPYRYDSNHSDLQNRQHRLQKYPMQSPFQK